MSKQLGLWLPPMEKTTLDCCALSSCHWYGRFPHRLCRGLWRKKWLLEHEINKSTKFILKLSMIEKILDNILFLDIETVPEAMIIMNWIRNESLWEHKTQYQRKDEHTRKIFTIERESGQNSEKSLYLCWLFCD
jgi:hypothetical protein